MTNTKRANGKLIRKIAKLDRAWRLAGKPGDSRMASDLGMYLGWAASRGMGTVSRKVQNRNAVRLGRPMDWPAYGV